MSFDALAWAAKQRAGGSGAKLVLLGLAECASRGEALAFPSVAELVEFSDLDRKSVIANLARLEARGLIEDTGRRCGRTKQIKVYRVCVETVPKAEPFESVPKGEPSQNRNSSVSSAKSPENGTRNKSEPGSDAKASSQRVAFAPPPGVSKLTWADYLKMRSKKRALMTATAYQRQCALLEKLAGKGHAPEEIVATSVERGWTGLFEPDERRKAASTKWVSPKGYEYRGTDEQVLREAERRGDMDTYWKVKGSLKRAGEALRV